MRRFCIVLSFALCELSVAEVATDGTLGPAVDLTGPDFRVEASLGRQSGPNLFHSLATLNLSLGESATFLAPAGVDRVIAGVSAGPSQINGTLRTEAAAGTDLWLINPSGIQFGSGAGFELNGSLFISTADELRFADGARFAPGAQAQSVFSVAEPSAFGFLTGPSTDIVFRNVETVVNQVPRLALVGGHIRIEGERSDLRIRAGELQFAAVGGPGEARVESGELVAESPLTGVVSLRDGARILSSEGGLDPAGALFIRAGRWEMQGGRVTVRSLFETSGSIRARLDDSMTLSGGAVVESVALLEGHGGDIELDVGGTVSLLGSAIDSRADFNGDGGAITIQAGELLVQGGRISTEAFGNGNAGTIRIDSAGLVRISGPADFTVGIASTAGSLSEIVLGRAGDIRIQAGSLEMDGGVLNSETLVLGLGQAGDLDIAAESVDLRNGAIVSSSSRGLGQGGNTRIQTDRLELRGAGTTVQTFTFFSGDAGAIEIQATDVVLNDQAGISASTRGAGAGGAISIRTARLRMGESTNITSDAIFALDDPEQGLLAGDAGDIAVFASESVTLNGSLSDPLGASRITSTSLGDGDAGNILVQAPAVTLSKGSLSSDTLLAGGNAGTVRVVTDRLLMDQGARISSDQGETATGTGGSVDIRVTGELLLRGEGPGLNGTIASSITTATLGSGDAGSTRIQAESMRLDGGLIGAVSAGSGDAGDVQISTGDVWIRNGGITTLATQTGGGRIDLAISGLLTLIDGSISTSVFGGADDAGDITVSRPQAVSLVGDSRVVANAIEGRGGNTRITTDALFLGSASVIEAKSERGIDGLIEIFAPDADLTQAVLALPAEFVDLGRQLVDPCQARRISASSTFRVTRRRSCGDSARDGQ